MNWAGISVIGGLLALACLHPLIAVGVGAVLLLLWKRS